MLRGLVLSLVLSVAPGCGSNHPIDRQLDRQAELAEYVCSFCPPALGASTTAECLGSQSQPTDAQRACLRGLYDASPDALGPVYACSEPILADYDRCLRDAIDSCPPTAEASRACQLMLTALEDCPSPDAGLAAMLDACFE